MRVNSSNETRLGRRRLALALCVVGAMATLAPAALADTFNKNPTFVSTLSSSRDVETGGGYLFWANTFSYSIGRSAIDGSSPNNLFFGTTNPVSGIEVQSGVLFFTADDVATGFSAIGKIDIDGSSPNQVLIPISGHPRGIAADGTYLYWANSSTGSIGRALLDGTSVEPNFITGATLPFGVTVSATHIYWSNDPSTIGRANIDGTGANQSFLTGVGVPTGLASDGTYLYWADHTGNTIGRSNLDGTGADLSFVLGLDAPVGVTVDGSFLYWTKVPVNNFDPSYVGRTSFFARYEAPQSDPVVALPRTDAPAATGSGPVGGRVDAPQAPGV